MRILMVSSFLPYPLFSGGHVRLYNIIKGLADKHEITLVCEKRDNQTENDVAEINKFTKKLITVPRKRQWTVTNILKTGLSPFPFLMVGHASTRMKSELSKLLQESTFDIIHVETFYVMQNIPETILPVVLIEHNIEYSVYKRFADTLPIVLRAPFLIDIQKIKYWEEIYWQNADKLVAVSNADKNAMDREDIDVVPNGVDLTKYQISYIKYQISKKEKRILFIGDFKWLQNRDSAEWILKEIWPKITQIANGKSQIDLKLLVVGRKIPETIKRLTNDESVIFDEGAEDTVEIFKKATVLLSPIRVGGGTSFKVLEAMASGVPVITTTLGAAGIGAKDGEEILIADKSEEIVKKLQELLGNDKLYEKIARNARKLIEEQFDWKIIVRKLESVYQSVIQRKTTFQESPPEADRHPRPPGR